jgi:hypothetical protein
MEKRFDAIVLVPLSLVVGVAIGISLITGNVPIQFISQAASVLLATFIAIVVIDLLIGTVANAVLNVLFNEPEEVPNTGAPGELTVLLVRDGDVVGELKSWDKPIIAGKRNFWANKLGRIFARRKGINKPGPS